MPLSFERPGAEPRAQEATRAVSVVVRAESAAPGVRKTVESALSLARAREPGTEVVLVHDCADRMTWDWLLELKHAHPELHLIDFGEPYGNQLARLEGARRAHHSHVCFAGAGADPEALARAIREAVPRSRAITVLQEGLGASAEQRLVLQSFAPGIPVPADGPPSRAASEPARRRRRTAVLVGAGCVCAILIAAVLELRAQSPSDAAASPGGMASSRPEIVAGSTRASATTAALEGGETWSLAGPVAPKPRVFEADRDPERTKHEATGSSPAAPLDAPSEASVASAAPAPVSEARSSPAPAQSSGSRPEKDPPAQNGQESSPAGQSTPPEAPAAAETPAAAPEPAPAADATPPLDGPVDQAAPPSPPTTAPVPPPALPPSTPPAAPPTTPPADQRPGNGNGNGHAYGHANGNGEGNGNGPKN